jgi:hypothetical protein
MVGDVGIIGIVGVVGVVGVIRVVVVVGFGVGVVGGGSVVSVVGRYRWDLSFRWSPVLGRSFVGLKKLIDNKLSL